MFYVSRRGRASVLQALRVYSTPSSSASCRAISSKTRPFERIRRIAIPSSQSRQFSCYHRQSAASATAAATTSDEQTQSEDFAPDTGDGPVTRFAELAERAMVSKTIVNTVTEAMRLDTMTPVQSATISETLKGDDVFVDLHTQARCIC